MKMINFFCLLVSVFGFKQVQKEEPRLIIEKSIVDIKRRKIYITCSLLNGADRIVFYKPNSEKDFCLRLNFFTLRDLSTKREVVYSPCHLFADLNRINLNDANSIEINPHCSYKFDLVLNVSKFNNSLQINHKYKAVFKINHRFICGGEPCNAFTGFLENLDYTFIYK